MRAFLVPLFIVGLWATALPAAHEGSFEGSDVSVNLTELTGEGKDVIVRGKLVFAN